MDDTGEAGSNGRSIEGFWRRLGALAIEYLLVALTCFLFGSVAFDLFAQMRGAERLFAFALALAYFGYWNSERGDGQTIGKRLLGIRVVDGHGNPLTTKRSLARYTLFGLPFVLNGLPLPAALTISPVMAMYSLILLGFTLTTVYLYVFNRRTRQTLHDLAVGSYVVRAEGQIAKLPYAEVWRGHLFVAAALGLFALAAPAIVARWLPIDSATMLPMYAAVIDEPDVVSAKVAQGSRATDNGRSEYLTTTIRLDTASFDDKAVARRFARLIAANSADASSILPVVVVLQYGYDMGYASAWKTQTHSFDREELE